MQTQQQSEDGISHKKPIWFLEWYLLAVAFVALLLLLFCGDARGDSRGKAFLVVKNCGERFCAEPMLTPKLVFAIKAGERPPVGQVIRCEVVKKYLQCENGLQLDVESLMLQSE